MCIYLAYMTHRAQFSPAFFQLSILNKSLSDLVNEVTPLHGQTLAKQMKKGCEKKVKGPNFAVKFGMTKTAKGKVKGEATIWNACV